MTRERAMTRKDAIDELREIQEIGGSDGRPSLGGRCPMQALAFPRLQRRSYGI
jgi:hypothetical protein